MGLIRIREWPMGRPVEIKEVGISRETSVCLDILLPDGRSVQIVVHDNADYADYLDGAILVRGYRPATEQEAADEAAGKTGPADREVLSFSAQVTPTGDVKGVRFSTREA